MIKITLLDKFIICADDESLNKWKIKFNAPVYNYFMSGDLLYTLVCMDYYVAPRGDSNVFCISNGAGKLIWSKVAIQGVENNAYTSIRPSKNNTLLAWDWAGHRDEIEIATGKLIERNYGK